MCARGCPRAMMIYQFSLQTEHLMNSHIISELLYRIVLYCTLLYCIVLYCTHTYIGADVEAEAEEADKSKRP